MTLEYLPNGYVRTVLRQLIRGKGVLHFGDTLFTLTRNILFAKTHKKEINLNQKIHDFLLRFLSTLLMKSSRASCLNITAWTPPLLTGAIQVPTWG